MVLRFFLRSAQSLEREDMNGDSRCQNSQCDAQPQRLDNSHNAITHSQPQQTDRYDFSVQRYGVILAKIANIATKIGVIEQPIV